MPDRQKVIKGLHCIIEGTVRCESCGYAIDKHGHHSCQQECAKDAIALLKKQEGVVPYIDIDEAKCPVCKVKLTRQELIGDDVLYEDFFDYCPHCGKTVKWNEADMGEKT